MSRREEKEENRESKLTFFGVQRTEKVSFSKIINVLYRTLGYSLSLDNELSKILGIILSDGNCGGKTFIGYGKYGSLDTDDALKVTLNERGMCKLIHGLIQSNDERIKAQHKVGSDLFRRLGETCGAANEKSHQYENVVKTMLNQRYGK